MPISNRSTLHSRLSHFVDWIRTDSDREEDIRTQARKIRSNISGQAEKDGLTVRSTPNSGSFAKRTGLRQHLRGKSQVEGQDVDLPFVVSPKTEDGEKLTSLLPRFASYAKASYPDVSQSATKSSIVLDFVGSGLRYDLVPMIGTPKDDEQILLRSDGQRRRTSVQKHISFVTRRTDTSNQEPGRVKFNEGVRLLKWWKEFRVSTSGIISDPDEIPTFLLDLLAAAAFDRVSVKATYGETMLAWLGYIANVVKTRQRVVFSDFIQIPAPTKSPWEVLDPVNAENNVADRLSGPQIDELADWFAQARDHLAYAMAADRDGQDGKSLDALVVLFGNPFHNHCETE